MYVAIPLSSIAKWKIAQLNRCPTAPAFYISVEGWRFDKLLRTAVYNVEIGVQAENQVFLFNSEKRYSDLLAIHKSLSKQQKELPDFPPKKYFGSRDVEFIRQRQIKLQKYFESISSIFHLDRNPEFNNTFHFDAIREKWQNNMRQCIIV